ncbi:MAG: FAD-dependent thymidylate synthase [Planctomycetota bacterium]
MSLSQVTVPAGAFETLDDSIGFVALVDRMQVDHALKVVNSARISYDKKKSDYGEQDRKLCRFLWEHGHTSPYRHSFYTFHWKAPLFVFRQAFKYQVGSGWREYDVDGQSVSLEVFDVMFDTDKGCSWNEVSGRYVQWTPEFYVPRWMRGNPPHGNKQSSVALDPSFDHAAERARMIAECQQAYAQYEERIRRGVAKEIARMCLPQSLYSQAYWTVSLQGVLHFLEQRLQPDAQYEIRRYAEGVFELVRPDFERLGITRDGLVAGGF